MLPAPCYIISDLHLGFAPPEVERTVLRFLRELPGRAGSLLINGDLFEFWFEWRHVIPRAGHRTLAALADLTEAGVPVLMIAGNHDCWGGRSLTEETGISYHVGPWSGTIAGWRTLIEHGDGLRGREDRGYRMIRPVLRHPISKRVFRWLHPDLGSALAGGSSNASRNYRARDGGAGLRAVAMRQLESAPELDLVLYAHSHVAALERGPTGGVYANAGSWLDAPTFLRVDPARIELREWRDSAEGVRLDALDRRAEKALA